MKKRKSITGNFIFNLLYTFTNILFPLVVISYASRILMPEGIGKVTYAQNICTYFTLFAGLGVSKHGVREIAKTNADSSNREQVFSDLYFIQAVSSLLLCGIYYFVINTIPVFSALRVYLNISGGVIITAIFNVEWFYTGLEEFEYIAVRNFIVKLASLVLLFGTVNNSKNLIQYTIVLVVSNCGNQIVNIIGLRKYIHRLYIPKNIGNHLKPAIILLSMNIAIELYTQLDTTMVGVICGDEYVAYYANANKIMRYASVAISSIGTVLMPRMSQMVGENKMLELKTIISKTANLMIVIAIPACIGMFVLSEDIIYVMLGNHYQQSIPTLKILSFLIPVLALGNLFGAQALVALSKDRELLLSVVLGAFSNVVFNSIFIPKYKHDGAALGSVIAELIVCIALYAFVKKFIIISLDKKNLGKTVIGALLMGLIVRLLNFADLSRLMELILGIIIGIIFFSLMEIILKNDMYVWLLNKLKNMVT